MQQTSHRTVYDVNRLAALLVVAIVCILFVGLTPAHASNYTVKLDGSGDFTTVQACANAANAGDTCLVYPGTYPEYVETLAGGTSETARLVFKAQGAVTMQGFNIKHPYVTVDGFDITGRTGSTAMINVVYGGNNCQILNNVLRDGVARVPGIAFFSTGGQSASNCVVRGNRLSNLNYVFLTINGDNHLFEGNTLEHQNSQDYLRLFGKNHVFRRNVFWRGSTVASTGNHPDFVQNFGGPGLESQNHLFEENWIQDLPSQFSQMNSGDGQVTNGILYDNVKDVTFRRNVIVNVSMNANIGLPGARFENNTFYRLSYEAAGLNYGGSLSRGDASRGTLRNNVFLGGGARALDANGSSGYYSVSGAVLSKEVLALLVTKEKDSSGNITLSGPITVAIFNNLVSSGYIGINGNILAKAKALTDISQFVLSQTYVAYKPGTYDALRKTVQLDNRIQSTFSADYDFVAGAAAAGFPAKKNSECISANTSTAFNFCEAHGINGGDPKLASLSNPLGPDQIPFTLDDGLKPRSGSPLCGKGEGGTDIGAFSCDPTKVFAASTNSPPAPTNLRILP